ncbi:hypothetical protein QFC20_007748 [Naganishia adeliensis]|uniref:Uncharacterized protein n=1 Tax=Naganishia adeliensis TaxID=92952 RepID=A0ACC2UX24_9TREE|nr:hypothetical protein QFC20_007748 [Naganishia adeliensis]
MYMDSDHALLSTESQLNVANNFATISTSQAAGYGSYIPIIPTSDPTGSFNTVECLASIPNIEQYAYHGQQIPNLYASPLAPSSSYVNLATRQQLDPSFYNESNALGLTFNTTQNINPVNYAAFSAQSSYLLPPTQASISSATMNPSLLNNSHVTQAANGGGYSALYSLSTPPRQRIDSSAEISGSPSPNGGAPTLPSPEADSSSSTTKSTSKAKKDKKKTYINSPKKKHKLKNVGKQTPMKGKIRATFRRCPDHTGKTFDNNPKLVRGCERCRLGRTVTSLLKNIEGRRLLDTERAEDDSTWEWKRQAEQTFRDLFNDPIYAMVYLRIRLVLGQFEQLQDYFNTHGHDLLFQWIR